jgi:hypothetical protein
MIMADAWTTVGTIASVVAAGAALVTVRFARGTVIESRAGRREAHLAHAEETRQQAQLLEATITAQEREMEERQRAWASELVLQRLIQLGRVIELLGETADIARLEIASPPEKVRGQIGTWTRITGALARVEAAVSTFERLGGPPLSDVREMSIRCRRMDTPPERVVGEAMAMLAEAQHIAATDMSLELPE